MKKFFSMDGKFTIFTVVGLMFLISYLFFYNPIFLQLGVLIAWIPDINKSLANYKNTGKVDFTLVLTGIILASTIIVLAVNLFSNF